MSKVELAIKFGSNEIIVYRKGLGIIARQSSYVATPINKPKGKIYAYGDDAKRLCELKTSKYELHQPIQGIDITNGHLAQQLIINIINNALFEGGSISALVAVPCALTEKKLLELKLILHSAGISKVTFVPNEVCIRANMSSVEDDAKVAIADIGKFLVDVSVLTRYDMLKGRSYLVGGGEMDIALATYIEDNYGVKITTEQAETIKDEIASMFDNDMYTVTFEGIDLNNEYKAVTIRANEARTAIVGIYNKIFDCIEEFIEELSPEISADIKRNGIMCVGGVSCVNGFVEYASKRLNLPVYVADNPRDAVILGAGKLLSLNKEDYPYIKL